MVLMKLSNSASFLGGLRTQSKLMLDASAGEKIFLNTPKKAIEIIEKMATNAKKILSDRAMVPLKRLLEVSTQDGLLAQQKLLTRKIEELTQQIIDLPQHFKLQSTTSIPKFKCFVCESC